MVGSEFQLCDFKFGPQTLRLGMNGCSPLAISNLEVRLGKPILLDVKLPQCAYGREMYGSSNGEPACLSYFRTTTDKGEPLPEVEVSLQLGRNAPLTHSHGRWQETMDGTLDMI